jgi:ribosomal protein L37AE/L43A
MGHVEEKIMRTIALGMVVLAVAACSSSSPTYTPAQPVYGSGGAANSYGTLVKCESINNTRETCTVDLRDRMVLVNQQLSDNPCIIGRTWGVSNGRNEIWVTDGCRAEFQVGGAPVAMGAFGRSVVCESQNNGKDRCPVDTSYGVQLARQISKNDCVRGDDWGFDENGIWVDHGCRAEFVLGGEDRFTPRTAPVVARVTCESQNEGMNRCAADTTYGVTLARQISSSTCVRGQTWGYDSTGIWVNRGCRAEFALGY